jgi:hypothetical protein
MYCVITTFEKTAEEIPYYIDTNLELKEQFREFIVTNNDLIVFLDVDNRVNKQTTTIVYDDETRFNQFMSLFNATFPTFFADRDAYCLANNISITRVVEQS